MTDFNSSKELNRVPSKAPRTVLYVAALVVVSSLSADIQARSLKLSGAKFSVGRSQPIIIMVRSGRKRSVFMGVAAVAWLFCANLGVFRGD